MKFYQDFKSGTTVFFLFFLSLTPAVSAAVKPDATFRGTVFSAGKVYDLAVQPDGKRLLAGNFIETNGSDRSTNIVRLNADDSLDLSFTCQTDSQIRKIAVRSDGKIYIGGFFDAVNGVVRDGLARLNADGTIDTSFNPAPIFGSFTDTTDILAQPDGKLLLIGTFVGAIVRFNEDGSRDTSFDVGTGPRFQNSPVPLNAFALQPDGKIVVTGRFDTFNGIARQFLARLNADGSVDTNFNAGADANVEGTALLILADNRILWTASNLIRRFGTNGTLDPTFVTDAAPLLRTTLRQQPNGKILLTYYRYFGDSQDGNFESFVLRLNINGDTDNSFPVLTFKDTIVYRAGLQSDGKILVGGNFDKVDNSRRNGVFLLDANGILNNAFNPVLKDRGTIADLAVQPDGKIIVGGSFYQINGVERNNIARLNDNGTVDSLFTASFESLVDSPPYFLAVRKIALTGNGKIIVGGRFYRLNNTERYQIVRLNSDGTTDNTFNLPQETVISAFQYFALEVQPDGKILTNGGTLAGGSGTWRVIRLNSDGTPDASFTNGARGLATDIKVQADGKIIAAGFFFNSASDVVRINSNGTLDAAFNGPTNVGGLNSTAVAVQPDGKVLVGQITGNGLIRLNQNGSVDAGFMSNITSNVNPRVWKILALPNGKIIVGGEFSQINSVNRNSLARLNANGSVDGSFNPNNLQTSGLTLALGLQSNGNLIFGSRFNRPTGARQDIGRILNSSAPVDFDGDGKTDYTVYRPNVGAWYSLLSATNFSFSSTFFGVSTDKIVPADYDGDGRTDVAVYRDGNWFWLNSSDNQFRSVRFGLTTDVPVPADYDADGKADPAVYRGGTWFVLNSSNNAFRAFQFGTTGDTPAAADYDADGQADFAVFRNGFWFAQQSAEGFSSVQFGQSGDVPVVGDFDADGKSDFTVFRSGNWFTLNSRDFSFRSAVFGLATDNPTVGDYDGDNVIDIGVWRSSNGTFFTLPSAGGFRSVQFGQTGDVPANISQTKQ